MSFELSLANLKEIGAACGLDAIGATTADAFPELVPHLQAYEARGLTGFEEADIERRTNPIHTYPWAKSIVSVAMAYLTDEGRELARRHPTDGLHGRVTVYSYGLDYHQVMKERLEKVGTELEKAMGRPVRWQVAVDTSPLVDRAVAERAGIGWVGKNCHLFTPQHGSYVFLGALVTDAAIEPAGQVIRQQCGDCSLCLTACPTGAIIAPGVIDARRCLSYITQMHGMIPVEFRRKLGTRVWGCDTCQTVCPENLQKTASSHEEYLPQAELAYPDLIEILQLSNRQFMRLYGHTAAAWRGLPTWKRNALIALGNCRDEAAIPCITPFLHHPREELRASAAWALLSIGGVTAKQVVAEAYEKEEAEMVRREMRPALDSVRTECAEVE